MDYASGTRLTASVREYPCDGVGARTQGLILGSRLKYAGGLVDCIEYIHQ